jgi:hypothetical protein
MKADLDETGTLVIRSETPVESFALTHWYGLWRKKNATFLVSTVERATDGSGAMDHSFAEVKERRS